MVDISGTDMLELGRKVLESQPFSRLLGAELTKLASREAVLTIPITADHTQQNGFVHGGVLSYASDNALTFAGGLALGAEVVTSEFKINYLRPAVGIALVAAATVIHAGSTQAICRAEIFVKNAAGDVSLCAVAMGTICKLGLPQQRAIKPE